MRSIAVFALIFLLSLSSRTVTARWMPSTGRTLLKKFMHHGFWYKPEVIVSSGPVPTEEPEHVVVYTSGDAAKEEITIDGYGAGIPLTMESGDDDEEDVLFKIRSTDDGLLIDRTFGEAPLFGTWTGAPPSGGSAVGNLVDGLDGFPRDRAFSFATADSAGPFGVAIAASGGIATEGTVDADADSNVEAGGSEGAVDSITSLDASDGGLATGGTISKVVTTPLLAFGTTVGGVVATPGANGLTTGGVSATSPFQITVGK